MRLLSFRYLRKQRIALLILILTLTASLFSITAYSFIGFYNGFTNYAGGDKNLVAIYSTVARTPFTSYIPLAAENDIAALDGVLVTSPEVIIPGVVKGESVFVRGVIPEDVSMLNPLIITQGSGLSLNDSSQAVVGQDAARKLGLRVGDAFVVFSVLSQTYVHLEVKGIFQSSESALNDEVLVPLYVGQWIRGASYDRVTLIRVKLDLNQTSVDQVYQTLANQAQQTNPAPQPSKSQAKEQLEALIPLGSSKFNLQNIGVNESQDFMSSYLNEYGISKNALIVLSVVVFGFASGAAISAITLFVNQHSKDIDTIRSIGVSSKKIKFDLAVKMVGWALLATALGTAISAGVITVFQRIGYLQVLSHTITFQLDPLIIVANFALLSLLIGVNMARMELRE